jgi:hypothetical protein
MFGFQTQERKYIVLDITLITVPLAVEKDMSEMVVMRVKKWSQNIQVVIHQTLR